jgi:hypothetical protein
MGEWGRDVTVDVLAQGQEARLLARKFGQSVVCGVGLRFQRHVPSVAVELPHQAGVRLKCFGGRQLYGIVGSPQSSCASERGKA